MQFSHHVKEYIDLKECIPIASGLPSDKRRDDLEALVWKAIQDAADFTKTEEAAKNAKAWGVRDGSYGSPRRRSPRDPEVPRPGGRWAVA